MWVPGEFGSPHHWLQGAGPAAPVLQGGGKYVGWQRRPLARVPFHAERKESRQQQDGVGQLGSWTLYSFPQATEPVPPRHMDRGRPRKGLRSKPARGPAPSCLFPPPKLGWNCSVSCAMPRWRQPCGSPGRAGWAHGVARADPPRLTPTSPLPWGAISAGWPRGGVRCEPQHLGCNRTRALGAQRTLRPRPDGGQRPLGRSVTGGGSRAGSRMWSVRLGEGAGAGVVVLVLSPTCCAWPCV